MAAADFSLRERDKFRLIKDRVIRYIVTAGGVAVFGALMLIFVYLASVVIPLFSPANLTIEKQFPKADIAETSAIGIDEQAQRFYTIDKNGTLSFFDTSTGEQTQQQLLANKLIHIVKAIGGFHWYAIAQEDGFVSFHRVDVSHHLDDEIVDSPSQLQRFPFAKPQEEIEDWAFAIQESANTLSEVWLVAVDDRNQLFGQYIYLNELTGEYSHEALQLPSGFDQVDQLLLTPNGRFLYVRLGNDLAVLERSGNRYETREYLSLSSREGADVAEVRFLAGAYSLLVSYSDNTVSQWFDVVSESQRNLKQVREFELPNSLSSVLTDSYRKGFYSFHEDGTVESTFTTNSNTVYSEKLFARAPRLTAISNNEKHLVAAFDDHIALIAVDNDYPEISFSALWQKLWYENYPEPDYVWQSTSADDYFEPKFSLVPIAFGTIKAALFAMLFSVPIAVSGAVYTAYFMSASMRRFVKPTIELMEALPTVIIGFLAGLWFAPLVEQNLATVLILSIFLPLVTFIVGLLWALMPKVWISALPKGWHSLILIPAYLVVIFAAFEQGALVEQWLFDGDARLMLANFGIDYDQRNALVVGFAMGFAVIPTIFTISEDAIFSVPKHLTDGSLALGATPWQALTTVVLVTAVPGIFSAIMMGLGRAVGETMIVLMATGNTPIMDWNIFEGMRSLSATIAVETPESEVGSAHYRLLFLAALILFTFTFSVNSVAEWVRQRLRDKYRSL